MVYSNTCKKSKKTLGFGFVFPVKKEINNFEDLLNQAGDMWKAESPNHGSLCTSWGTVALLPNPKKEINHSILKLWKKQLRNAIQEKHTNITVLENEKPIINKSGILKIEWPSPIGNKTLNDFDLLLATVTSPEVDVDSYPSATKIASKMILNNYFEYFFKNLENGIKTYQDVKILEILLNRELNPYLIDIPDQICSVDSKKIKQYDSEDKYMELSVELFKEIAEIEYNITNFSYKENDKIIDNKDVIICGFLIRILKLNNGFLDMICQKKLEFSNIFLRCLFESLINLSYLLYKDDENLYNQYIKSSLRNEKELLELINENISNRGKELPIEKRMKKSIENIFNQSPYKISEIDSSKHINWGGSLKQKVHELKLENFYIVFFGFPSYSVHGTWVDIIKFNLSKENNGYFPNYNCNMPRPQLLLSIGMLSCFMMKYYLERKIPNSFQKYLYSHLILNVFEKIKELDKFHELFLQQVV